MVSPAYSGQPWPEPSVTVPVTVTDGSATNGTSTVTVVSSTTSMSSTVSSANPYAEACSR